MSDSTEESADIPRRVKATMLVRARARLRGLDINEIRGTGRYEEITSDDVDREAEDLVFGGTNTEELLDRLKRGAGASRRRKYIRWGVFITYMAVGYALFTGYRAFHYIYFVCNMLSTPILSWIVMTATWRDRKAAQRLATIGDKRAVGLLLEAREFDDRRLAAAAETALIRLLPKLQASDSYLLTPAQRARLYRYLEKVSPRTKNDDSKVRMTLAALKALEQIGDAAALPIVTRLAEDARSTAIRDAATACLPALSARVERQQQAATLLRPSYSTEAVLLRPAGAASDTPTEQLLRA